MRTQGSDVSGGHESVGVREETVRACRSECDCLERDVGGFSTANELPAGKQGELSCSAAKDLLLNVPVLRSGFSTSTFRERPTMVHHLAPHCGSTFGRYHRASTGIAAERGEQHVASVYKCRSYPRETPNVPEVGYPSLSHSSAPDDTNTHWPGTSETTSSGSRTGPRHGGPNDFAFTVSFSSQTTPDGVIPGFVTFPSVIPFTPIQGAFESVSRTPASHSRKRISSRKMSFMLRGPGT